LKFRGFRLHLAHKTQFGERQMIKRFGLALLIVLFVLGAGGVAARDGITKRVKFAKGKSSATFSNAVIRGERDTYILGAKSGQRMTVRVTALENNAVFQIEGPQGEYLEGAGETDDATSVSVTLPDSGDYRIIVGGTRGNASYRLTVSIR
jgi:type II secretory pathway pseudopilin PulG